MGLLDRLRGRSSDRPQKDSQKSERFGQFLVEKGLLETDQLEAVTRAAVLRGERLGTVAFELGLLDLNELCQALGEHLKLNAAAPLQLIRDAGAHVGRIPEDLVIQMRVVPVGEQAGRIQLAMEDPQDQETINKIAAAVRQSVHALATPEVLIYYALHEFYGVTELPRRVAALIEELRADPESAYRRQTRSTVSADDARQLLERYGLDVPRIEEPVEGETGAAAPAADESADLEAEAEAESGVEVDLDDDDEAAEIAGADLDEPAPVAAPSRLELVEPEPEVEPQVAGPAEEVAPEVEPVAPVAEPAPPSAVEEPASQGPINLARAEPAAEAQDEVSADAAPAAEALPEPDLESVEPAEVLPEPDLETAAPEAALPEPDLESALPEEAFPEADVESALDAAFPASDVDSALDAALPEPDLESAAPEAALPEPDFEPAPPAPVASPAPVPEAAPPAPVAEAAPPAPVARTAVPAGLPAQVSADADDDPFAVPEDLVPEGGMDSGPEPAGETLLKLAKAALLRRQGRLVDAISVYREILVKSPGNHAAQAGVAELVAATAPGMIMDGPPPAPGTPLPVASESATEPASDPDTEPASAAPAEPPIAAATPASAGAPASAAPSEPPASAVTPARASDPEPAAPEPATEPASAAPAEPPATAATPARPAEPEPAPAPELDLDVARAKIAAAASRDSVGDALLEAATAGLEVAALFAVDAADDLFVGIRGRGADLEGRDLTAIMVPTFIETVLRDGSHTAEGFRGTPPDGHANEIFFEELGRDRPTECVVLPVMRDAGAASLLLYGDAGQSAIQADFLDQLSDLCAAAGESMDRFVESG